MAIITCPSYLRTLHIAEIEKDEEYFLINSTLNLLGLLKSPRTFLSFLFSSSKFFLLPLPEKASSPNSSYSLTHLYNIVGIIPKDFAIAVIALSLSSVNLTA